MNILILVSGTVNSSLSHRPLYLATELQKLGHTVTLIAPSRDKYSNFELDKSRSSVTNCGVEFIYPYQGKSKVFLVSLLPYLFSCTYQVLGAKTDIVYIFKPTPISTIGLVAKLIKRKPIILDLDDLGSEVMNVEKQPKTMSFVVRLCEKLCARFANYFVVASQLLNTEVRQKYPTKPVLLLSNGVNVQEFSPNHKIRGPKIVFFGALNRSTILLSVLEAVAILYKVSSKPFKIEIYGGGKSLDQLIQFSNSLGLENVVKFHGWTKPAVFASRVAYGDVALCIMPKERTTAACSNQKVFQYMALGLAVIVSKVGDLPTYVKHGQAGIVIDGSDKDLPKLLSQALNRLLTDDNKRLTIAENGLKLARSQYTWEFLATQLSNFLKGYINL